MSILRNKFNVRFVQVPNALVTDTRISIPARLVYIYLRSKPDGWIVRNSDVMKSLGIKDNGAMAKYWRELEETGWIIRHKTAAGTFDYELNEVVPVKEKANEGNSATGENPYKEKSPTINNTDLVEEKEYSSNTDCSDTPLYPPAGETSKITSELKKRINTLFNRRDNTTWSKKETDRLKQIARRNGVLEECTEIERLYNSGYLYRRRAVQTFLNNWETELDRARNNAGNDKQEKDYYASGRHINNDPEHYGNINVDEIDF